MVVLSVHTVHQSKHTSQEVGDSLLIGENGLVVMTGMELVEWYQIHQTHGFRVIGAIPFTPFQPLK
jgi:hypothetical protein